MKINEIKQIVAEHPDAVFRIRNVGYEPYQYVGVVQEKAWGASRPTTKVVMKAVSESGATWTRKFTPASILYVVANSLTEHQQRVAEQRAKSAAARAAEKAARAAKEAAQQKAREALHGHEDEVKAGLANVLGCKREAITVDWMTGEVRIRLAGDVAMNIVHERAYAY